MQTFLPIPSFPHSAAVLDYKRLNKQNLECMQLLNVLRRTREAVLPGAQPELLSDLRRSSWMNHPCARQWRGYESALALYMTFTHREWLARGYNSKVVAPYDENWQPRQDLSYCGPLAPVERIVMPPWLGENVYHACMRSNLLRKDPAWYGQFGWTEGTELAYTWPEGLGIDVYTDIVHAEEMR